MKGIREGGKRDNGRNQVRRSSNIARIGRGVADDIPLISGGDSKSGVAEAFPCDHRVTNERLRAPMDCNSIAAAIAPYLQNRGK